MQKVDVEFIVAAWCGLRKWKSAETIRMSCAGNYGDCVFVQLGLCAILTSSIKSGMTYMFCGFCFSFLSLLFFFMLIYKEMYQLLSQTPSLLKWICNRIVELNCSNTKAHCSSITLIYLKLKILISLSDQNIDILLLVEMFFPFK